MSDFKKLISHCLCFDWLRSHGRDAFDVSPSPTASTIDASSPRAFLLISRTSLSVLLWQSDN
jgi:hypothetical protein